MKINEVKREHVGNFFVSTLKPFADSAEVVKTLLNPQVYETCIFFDDSKDCEVVAYYDTWESAAYGHDVICNTIRFTRRMM